MNIWVVNIHISSVKCFNERENTQICIHSHIPFHNNNNNNNDIVIYFLIYQNCKRMIENK